MCARLPAASTNRRWYCSFGVAGAIQYARKPSPVNLSNQPPGVPIPLRTAETNLSMIFANRSKWTASFIRSVDSRMSAAITNICKGVVSMIASSSCSRSNRSSQSGGACGREQLREPEALLLAVDRLRRLFLDHVEGA